MFFFLIKMDKLHSYTQENLEIYIHWIIKSDIQKMQPLKNNVL